VEGHGPPKFLAFLVKAVSKTKYCCSLNPNQKIFPPTLQILGCLRHCLGWPSRVSGGKLWWKIGNFENFKDFRLCVLAPQLAGVHLHA